MPRIAFHSLIVILLLTGPCTEVFTWLEVGFDLASSYRNEERMLYS